MAGVLLDALDGDADGAILAVADAVPETAYEVFRAHAAGDRAAAAEAQDGLRPLAECFGPRFGVSGIKAALDARGWPGGGPPRPPLRPLDVGSREVVERALGEAGIDLDGSPS
jgi:4-hydroxy-tetrahydrodipicolinate synthase